MLSRIHQDVMKHVIRPYAGLAEIMQDHLFIGPVPKDYKSTLKMPRVTPGLVQFIHYEHREIIDAWIMRNAISLKHVRDQTPEMCMMAVKNNPYVLQYVREQTPEICMAAVEASSYALPYVREQTEEICLAALYQDRFYKRIEIYIEGDAYNKTSRCLNTESDIRAFKVITRRVASIILNTYPSMLKVLDPVRWARFVETYDVDLDEAKDIRDSNGIRYGSYNPGGYISDRGQFIIRNREVTYCREVSEHFQKIRRFRLEELGDEFIDSIK